MWIRLKKVDTAPPVRFQLTRSPAFSSYPLPGGVTAVSKWHFGPETKIIIKPEHDEMPISNLETRSRISSLQSHASRRDREFLPFSLMLRDEIENFFPLVSCFETRSRISVFTLVHIKAFTHPPENQNLNLFLIICILNGKKEEEIWILGLSMPYKQHQQMKCCPFTFQDFVSLNLKV